MVNVIQFKSPSIDLLDFLGIDSEYLSNVCKPLQINNIGELKVIKFYDSKFENETSNMSQLKEIAEPLGDAFKVDSSTLQTWILKRTGEMLVVDMTYEETLGHIVVFARKEMKDE